MLNCLFLQTTSLPCGQVDGSATSGTKAASPPACSQSTSTGGSGQMEIRGEGEGVNDILPKGRMYNFASIFGKTCYPFKNSKYFVFLFNITFDFCLDQDPRHQHPEQTDILEWNRPGRAEAARQLRGTPGWVSQQCQGFKRTVLKCFKL